MFSTSQLIRRIVQTSGSELATVDGERQQTWQQYMDKLARFAGGLQSLGVKKGDCVAMLALNSDRYFEFMYGVPWAGGVFQPINTRLAGPEVVYWLNDSEAKVLLVDSTFVPLIQQIRSELNYVEHFIFVDQSATPDGYSSYDSLVDHTPVADAGRKNDDIAALFYTGGTTGRSKGVMLTHTNLVANALQSVAVMDCSPGDKILHVAPMFHIADAFYCMTSLVVGGTNYFLPGFEPVATMNGIEKYQIDRLLMVPTMINMLVNHPSVGDFDMSGLRAVAYGASPMPESVIRKALQELPNAGFYQAYGQTEASPIITVLDKSRHTFEGPLAGKIQSAGQAIPGVDIAIFDDNDQSVANGVVGEICIRGANVMKGYRNMPEQTSKAIVNQWLHTGDGGYLDDEGFVFIVDRVKDMIISGGENVYSSEVENAIYQYPNVNQCAVIGIPSEKWGEQVHAVVVMNENMTTTEEDIMTYCRTQIAGFKCPRSISFRQEPLPLSGAGKILKTELRAPFWAKGARNVN
ncbi:MAG TPA: fatty-acid--CoA ligase [Porticoccaceae bacterium]|jgi:long-chain acyl-CoA synthetase|nr:fatty-acid--CoA ligase [Porticoccaceae bacterium]